MKTVNYRPLTPKDVAHVLGICSDSAITGEVIANDMLCGTIRFEQSELERLADYKGITVNELAELDESFKIYQSLDIKTKKAIAVNMLNKGFDAELAAELTELPLDKVKELQK